MSDLKWKHKKAISLLVAYQLKEDVVAEKLDITVDTLRAWMKKPEFIKALEEKTFQVEKIDSKYRVNQNKQITNQLYEEIQERLASGSLKKMNMRQLIKLTLELNQDIRRDTPGDATQRIKSEYSYEDIDQLVEKYNNSRSSQYAKGLRLVEPPQKDEEKEKKHG